MKNPRPVQTALAAIRFADPVMPRLMDAVGPFTLRPEGTRRFSVLARVIISQQVVHGNCKDDSREVGGRA